MVALLFALVPPFPLHGVYMSPAVVKSGKGRSAFLRMVERGYLNAVVIDLKTEKGLVPLRDPYLSGFYREFIEEMRERGIYVIGRLICFKDSSLAFADSGRYALRDSSGKIWFHPKSGYWVDPSVKEIWDYLRDIAVEAIKEGVCEIQFDYVRFPSFPGYVFNGDKGKTLVEFLKYMRSCLDTLAFLGADVYGFTVWLEHLSREGQSFDSFAKYVDAIYPMLYPSHFGDNFMADRGKEGRTFGIIYESMVRAEERIKDPFVRIIPYLQAFDWKRSRLGEDYILNQINAAEQASGSGWILWEPSGNYYQAYEEYTRYLAVKEVEIKYDSLRYTCPSTEKGIREGPPGSDREGEEERDRIPD
ncbi:hypothetical protein DRQ16_00905 [bacterium]|nr:MAG: hypothetical protein DRQ16_00905 [bacterium]